MQKMHLGRNICIMLFCLFHARSYSYHKSFFFFFLMHNRQNSKKMLKTLKKKSLNSVMLWSSVIRRNILHQSTCYSWWGQNINGCLLLYNPESNAVHKLCKAELNRWERHNEFRVISCTESENRAILAIKYLVISNIYRSCFVSRTNRVWLLTATDSPKSSFEQSTVATSQRECMSERAKGRERKSEREGESTSWMHCSGQPGWRREAWRPGDGGIVLHA